MLGHTYYSNKDLMQIFVT